jgi:FAD/FMN-containing dehydrogenase
VIDIPPQSDFPNTEFAGDIIVPGDAEYHSARPIWNAGIDKHQALITRCKGVSDIVTAVKYAGASSLTASIRGGGHDVSGRALCNDGIVIDLSAMRSVIVDPHSRSVLVQGGATLADVDRETRVYGLAVPTGTVGRTGIGDLTLWGGVGWLVRKHGLTCDNLLACEVVTANGKLVTASKRCNRDLFWGLRGGGTNLGIVSLFKFAAHPVSTVLGGLILYPRDEASAVLRNYRAFMLTASEELTAFCALMHSPEGRPVVGVAACYCGDQVEGERVFRALREFGSPILEAIRRMPFTAMQKLLDGAFPDGTYNYWKSTFLKAMNDEAIDVIIEHADRATSALSSLMIEFYGGAATRVHAADSAFPHRLSEFKVVIAAQWTDPNENALHTSWARKCWSELTRFSSGDHLLTKTSDVGEQDLRAGFGNNYNRMVELKERYDPTNLFSGKRCLPKAPLKRRPHGTVANNMYRRIG